MPLIHFEILVNKSCCLFWNFTSVRVYLYPVVSRSVVYFSTLQCLSKKVVWYLEKSLPGNLPSITNLKTSLLTVNASGYVTVQSYYICFNSFYFRFHFSLLCIFTFVACQPQQQLVNTEENNDGEKFSKSTSKILTRKRPKTAQFEGNSKNVGSCAHQLEFPLLCKHISIFLIQKPPERDPS